MDNSLFSNFVSMFRDINVSIKKQDHFVLFKKYPVFELFEKLHSNLSKMIRKLSKLSSSRQGFC